MIKKDDVVAYTAQSYGTSETTGVVDWVNVFVPYTIVGECADVKINFVKGRVAYGDVVRLTKVSPKRVEPVCKYFGICGGCSLMHMKYSEQLAFKRQKVQTNLKKLGNLDVEVAPCVPSRHKLSYRNKLSLPVGGKTGCVKIGMYRKGTHDIVDMDNCLLGGMWSKTLVGLFRKFVNDKKIAPYNEKDFSGEVRHLVARYVDEQLLVTIVFNGPCKRDLTEFFDTLCQNFDNVGLFVNENSGKNNVILGKVTKHVAGLNHIVGNHMDTEFHLRPDSFFQVNDDVKNLVYEQVKQALDVTGIDVLVDCFSGVGVLTNVMSSDRYDTYGIEIVPSAVQDANEMARLNNSPRVQNLLGDVNEILPRLVAQNKGKRIAVLVDPPRKGLGENICNTICDSGADNLAYISCDSATLARDLSVLAKCYDIASVTPYDMFPNTDQVETVVLLQRKLAAECDKTDDK